MRLPAHQNLGPEHSSPAASNCSWHPTNQFRLAVFDTQLPSATPAAGRRVPAVWPRVQLSDLPVQCSSSLLQLAWCGTTRFRLRRKNQAPPHSAISASPINRLHPTCVESLSSKPIVPSARISPLRHETCSLSVILLPQGRVAQALQSRDPASIQPFRAVDIRALDLKFD